MTVLIGFDGFTDHLYTVVDRRTAADQYTPLTTLAGFRERLRGSCNFELILKERRLGGNGPNMAEALVDLGIDVDLIGCLGLPIEPLFAPLVKRCQRFTSLEASGTTHAMEFADGKIMLGLCTPLHHIDVARLQTLVDLLSRIEKCRILAMVNWTMLPHMNGIWQWILKELFPQLKKPPTLFIDLADPAKRSDGDLQCATHLLEEFAKQTPVTLSLNEREASRLQHMPHYAEIIIHARERASVSYQNRVEELSWPVIEHPHSTTGAGDHFNAGYISALLQGKPPKERLRVAAETAARFLKKPKNL